MIWITLSGIVSYYPRHSDDPAPVDLTKLSTIYVCSLSSSLRQGDIVAQIQQSTAPGLGHREDLSWGHQVFLTYLSTHLRAPCAEMCILPPPWSSSGTSLAASCGARKDHQGMMT